MVEEELARLLVDELVDRMTIAALIVAGIWLVGTVLVALIREMTAGRRHRVGEEAATERLRIEATAATDQARIKATAYMTKKEGF